MGNLRLAIASLAALLLLLSIPPVRRKLPGLRGCPAGVELLLWLGFVFLCLAALASVRTVRSTELSQASARAVLYFAGQALDSLLGPAALWVSGHEPGVAVVTVGAVGLAWVVVAARAVTAFRRELQPHPRLGDWWEVKLRRVSAPRFHVRPAPFAASVTLMDAPAAALYLGVSKTTVYRWARAGRLRSTRADARLRFSSGDLAAIRAADSRESHA